MSTPLLDYKRRKARVLKVLSHLYTQLPEKQLLTKHMLNE